MAEFGYHTIGDGFDNHSNAAIYANGHTYSPGEDGVLDSIFVHCRKASAGTIQVKFALYDVSDDSLVAQTVEIDVIYDGGAYHWYEAAVVGEVDVFAAKNYQFAFKQSDSCYIKKNVGATDRDYDVETYGDPWPNPGNWTTEDAKPHEYSAYATYTPSGAGVTALDFERKTRGVARGLVRGLALWLFVIKRTHCITWLSRWSIRRHRLLSRPA